MDVKGTNVPTLVFGEVMEDRQPLVEAEETKELQETLDDTILSEEEKRQVE